MRFSFRTNYTNSISSLVEGKKKSYRCRENETLGLAIPNRGHMPHITALHCCHKYLFYSVGACPLVKLWFGINVTALRTSFGRFKRELGSHCDI